MALINNQISDMWGNLRAAFKKGLNESYGDFLSGGSFAVTNTTYLV
jgi:hypothetical protein